MPLKKDVEVAKDFTLVVQEILVLQNRVAIDFLSSLNSSFHFPEEGFLEDTIVYHVKICFRSAFIKPSISNI